jgi:hypothetical protein
VEGGEVHPCRDQHLAQPPHKSSTCIGLFVCVHPVQKENNYLLRRQLSLPDLRRIIAFQVCPPVIIRVHLIVIIVPPVTQIWCNGIDCYFYFLLLDRHRQNWVRSKRWGHDRTKGPVQPPMAYPRTSLDHITGARIAPALFRS